jgi:hypothetical protein
MATSADTFIRAIRHTNDLVLEYIRTPPTYEQVDFLLKVFSSGITGDFVRLKTFYEAFCEKMGFSYLNELLSNWNKIRFDNFLDEKQMAERGWKDFKLKQIIVTNGGTFWQLNDGILEIILENPNLVDNTDFIISSKIWRGLYDYQLYKYSHYYSKFNFCGREDLKYFAYNLHNKTGIPDHFWNNPLIRPHMLSDPYLKDCIIPLLSTDIPYLKSPSDSSLSTRVDSLIDELKTIEKKSDTSKLIEIIGNLERRIEDLERKDHSSTVSLDPIPSAPPIDYHSLYLEQKRKVEELEKIISEKETSSPFITKTVIDSMKLEEHFWHSLQKRINISCC